MKKTIIYLFLLLVLGAAIATWLAKRKTSEATKNVPSDTNLVFNAVSPTNQAESATLKTNRMWTRPPNVDDAGWAYATKIWDILMHENQPIKFYGRIVDQNDQPVSNAQLVFRTTRVDEKKVASPAFLHMQMGSELEWVTNVVYSDAEGKVQLVDLTGKDLSILSLTKNGYEWRRPDGLGTLIFEMNGKTTASGTMGWGDVFNPDKGMLLQLWKKGETEKLVSANYSVPVEPYGTNWHCINLISGKINDFKDADLLFWFETVKDAGGNPARQFRFQIASGGLILDTGIYSYLAPETGYEPEWDWYYEPFGKNAKDDLSALMRKKFYVKLRNGKVYGSVTWHWSLENEVGISSYLNPSGSRNLEPDPNKLITDAAEIRRLDEATRTR